MKFRKNDTIFFALSALILAVAVIFVFVGARASGPETDYHEFSIPVAYEEYGEARTETVVYCCQYWTEDKSFHGYYEDSGMPDTVNMGEDDSGSGWWLELSLEPGYLMGDPAYADFYADGMPEPAIGYFDEDWNEHTGAAEAEIYGIKLIGCEYPEPIENQFIDKGVKLDHMAIGVVTALTFVILLLGVILVKKGESVVYQSRDKAARVLNWVVGVFTLPLLFALGDEWDLMARQPVDSVLAALMAPITVLGICASVILRRKGKSWQGMVAQFAGLLLFLYLIFANMLIGFGPYLLFLVAGAAVGILLAVRAPKGEVAVPTALDRVSLVTNIALIPVYAIFSVLMLFMAAITEAKYGVGPTLEFFARMLSFVIAAAPIYCGIALGMSVSLRKKGRSLAGFLVQFAGFGGFLMLLLIDMIPWISITIN